MTGSEVGKTMAGIQSDLGTQAPTNWKQGASGMDDVIDPEQRRTTWADMEVLQMQLERSNALLQQQAWDLQQIDLARSDHPRKPRKAEPN